MNDFFNTLGIEATKEEKKIKKAYRARLHAVNPEDDPDGFKRLREAYEEALKYARQKEEEPENLSPAEEFISRCEQLYKDFYRRIDEQEWEKLFSEDICISLESGEEVRQRFLVFLMENFRLPSPVWKKIDQTFSITGNRKELLELFPEPYVDFLQQVVRYNGALNYELFEGDVSEDVAVYDTPHGVANAILLPTVMEYNAPFTGDKYKYIAKAMGVEGVDDMTQEEYRKAAVDAVKKLSQDVGIPADLKAIVKDEDVQFLAESAYADACRPGNPRDTSVEEIKALYRSLM